MAGLKRAGNYSDATSVLVAPRSFYELHSLDSKKFECYVSHEDLATKLSVFGWAGAGV
jgi:hypothetical protein